MPTILVLNRMHFDEWPSGHVAGCGKKSAGRVIIATSTMLHFDAPCPGNVALTTRTCRCERVAPVYVHALAPCLIMTKTSAACCRSVLPQRLPPHPRCVDEEASSPTLGSAELPWVPSGDNAHNVYSAPTYVRPCIYGKIAHLGYSLSSRP